jgi:histidine triad (HIT) family protein
MHTASDCIFCKIVAGEIPAEKVYEDADTLAFLDINPNNFGHTLVLPKEHFGNIFDLPENVFCAMQRTAQKIARALKGTGAEGVNIISNNDSAAGQVVFHAHTHVIPRYADDGYRHWPQKKYESDAHMKQTGEKIRTELKKSA